MSSTPKIGLFGINMGLDPDAMARVTQAAEAAGFESVWTGEHIVLPDPQAPPSPAAPETPMVDTAATLAYLAAVTDPIKLGSGILILPQRQPAVLAKSLASVDHLSGGRLLFGLGVGYLEPEMTACSTPMARRGERADEYLAAMRVLWTTDAGSFDGEFVTFDSVTANPKPTQPDLHTAVAHRPDRRDPRPEAAVGTGAMRHAGAGPGKARNVSSLQLNTMCMPYIFAEPAQGLRVLPGGTVELLAAVVDVLAVFRQVRVQADTMPARQLCRFPHQILADGEWRTRCKRNL